MGTLCRGGGTVDGEERSSERLKTRCNKNRLSVKDAIYNAEVAELVDVADSKPAAERRASSILALGTI